MYHALVTLPSVGEVYILERDLHISVLIHPGVLILNYYVFSSTIHIHIIYNFRRV